MNTQNRKAHAGCDGAGFINLQMLFGRENSTRNRLAGSTPGKPARKEKRLANKAAHQLAREVAPFIASVLQSGAPEQFLKRAMIGALIRAAAKRGHHG